MRVSINDGRPSARLNAMVITPVVERACRHGAILNVCALSAGFDEPAAASFYPLRGR
jgi:hypothetical protein